MFQQTPQKRVLFSRGLTSVGAGVFVVVLLLATILHGGFIFTPEKAYAATNGTLNFQARLQNTAGNIVPDGNYNVQFKLYNVSSAGAALWTETYQNSNAQGVIVRNGYLTANLGSITAFPGTINWDQDLWVTLNIGGTSALASPTYDGEMNPRLKLTAVPYAFRAGQLAQFNAGNGFTSTLGLAQPTVGNQVFQLADQGAAGTYTICIQSSAACGFASATNGAGYIQNQNAGPQATSNFWISGTGRADTAMQAPSFDVAAAGILSIGTGTLSTGITIGSTTTTGTLTLGQSTASQIINLGNATIAAGNTGTINVGTSSTGTGKTAITIGSTNGASTLVLQAGTTGSVSIGTVGAATISSTTNIANTTNGTGTQIVNIGSSANAANTVTLEAGNTGKIQIGNGATAHTIQIGSGAAVQGITIGSTNSTSSLLLQAGTGSVNIGSVGATTTTSTTHIADTTNGTGTQTVAIGSNANVANALTLEAGNTGKIQIGNSTAAHTIQIGAGGTAIQAVTIGSSSSSSVTTIQSGTSNINLTSNGATAGTVVKSNTNSTSAFQVQNSGGTPVFNVDTANNLVNVAGSLQTGGTTRLDSTGNLTNIANYSGSGTIQASGTTGSSYIMSSLGLGTTNPQAASALTIVNGSWISSVDAAGTGYINMFQVNASNQIQVGAALATDGGIVLPSDGGAITAIDESFSTGITAGTANSYTFGIGQANALTVYGENDGSGNAQNVRVGIGSSITPGYTLDVGGDINTNTAFRINGTLGATTTCSGGQVLQNQVVVGGITTGGTCATAGGGGIATIGTIDTQTKSANGAVISGTSLYLQTADASNPGLLSTAAQTIAGVKTFNNGITIAANGNFTNAGSTLNTAIALTNFASNVAIGTAAATVDVSTSFTINQTTAAITLTLPNPTVATAGRVVYVANIGTASFTMYNVVVSPATTSIFLWNGTAWTSAGIDGSGANYIQNQSASNQVANFKINGTGTAATLQAATFDLAAAGTLSIGTGALATTVNIATSANAHTIALGNGAAVQGITIGSTNSTSSLLLQAGTGNLQIQSQGGTLGIGNNAVAQTITIGNATGATAVSVLCGTGACGFGNNAVAHATTVGSATGAAATTIQAGTGGMLIQSQGGTLGIGNNAVAQTLAIGNATGATSVTISSGTGGISIGNEGVGNTIQVGDANAAVTQTVSVGNNTNVGSTSTVNVGSQIGSSTTNIQGGTGGINLKATTAGTSAAIAHVMQGGAGDAAIELNSGTISKSMFLGVDTSANGNFVVNSSTSVTNTGFAKIKWIQSQSWGDTVSSTARSTSFDSNVTAGNLIVASIGWNTSTTSTVTCSDSRGDTFVTVTKQLDATNGYASAVCYAYASSSGADTVTATFGAASIETTIVISEYSGVAPSSPVDAFTSSVGNATTATDNITSGSMTTTANADLIYGSTFTGTGDAYAGTGFTDRWTSTGAGYPNHVEDRLLATPGTIAATHTGEWAGPYTAIGVAFKPATVTGSTDLFSTPIFSMTQAGEALFKNSTNSTTAFQIQDSAGNSLFRVDTLSGVVVVGGVNGSATFDAAGSLTFKGNAAKYSQISMYPEYPNSVLDAQSDAACVSANNGTLTSGYDPVKGNYYNWTTSNSTSQCYDVVVQVQIPNTFIYFDGAPLQLNAKTDNTANSSVAIQVIDSDGSPDGTFNYATPTLSTSWNDVGSTVGNFNGNYYTYSSIKVKIRMTAKSGANVKIGYLGLNWFSNK